MSNPQFEVAPNVATFMEGLIKLMEETDVVIVPRYQDIRLDEKTNEYVSTELAIWQLEGPGTYGVVKVSNSDEGATAFVGPAEMREGLTKLIMGVDNA